MPKRQQIQPTECPECGNPRALLGECVHCGSHSVPLAVRDCIVLNLEIGGPSGQEALDRLTQTIRGASEVGIRALIVIHGYGSSGTGGKIKWVVRDALENNFFSDRVDEYYFGEGVAFASSGYYALLKRRPSLKEHLDPFKVGNAGITVLLMR